MQNTGASLRGFIDCHEIAKQLQVESALLVNIEKCVRIALNWKTGARGTSRKLATLRFVTLTFEHHLTRFRVLSEHGGYLNEIVIIKPELTAAVESLRVARDGLQAELRRLMAAMEEVAPTDAPRFETICAAYGVLLDALGDHGQHEQSLLQRSLVEDEGGSG